MTEGYWTMANGQSIRITAMTDRHLVKAIRLLERLAQQRQDSIPYPNFQGEMAQWQADQEWLSAEFGDWDQEDERHVLEQAAALHPRYADLVHEAQRRGARMVTRSRRGEGLRERHDRPRVGEKGGGPCEGRR